MVIGETSPWPKSSAAGLASCQAAKAAGRTAQRSALSAVQQRPGFQVFQRRRRVDEHKRVLQLMTMYSMRTLVASLFPIERLIRESAWTPNDRYGGADVRRHGRWA